MPETTFPCYAQTMPGVETIAWLEVRARLAPVSFGQYLFAKNQNGIVLFDYGGPPEEMFRLRTTEDVFLQALSVPRLSRGRQDLAHISEMVRGSEALGAAVNRLMRLRRYSQPPTYRIISRQFGRYQYERHEFEAAVARGMAARYPRWQPVADGGQVEVWANLLGSHLLCGLRLSDRRMRHRFRKLVELPGSLRPSVAGAMVFLSEPTAGEVFLDPMSGSGTILLERRAAGPAGRLLGGDIGHAQAAATQRNLAASRAHAPLLTGRWDARRLPLPTGVVDKVVVNLPFGRQMGSPEELAALYPQFSAELTRVLRPGGLAVLLSSKFDLVKESVRRQPALQIQTGYSIAILGHWGRIYLIRHL